MTRTDQFEWASARVKHVKMKVVTEGHAERPVPVMEVQVHYIWKSRSFSKKIRSVLN